MIDYEAEYAFDYLDWETLDQIGTPGGGPFPSPQHIYQVVVTSNESALLGILSTHQSHWTSYPVACRTHGRDISFNRYEHMPNIFQLRNSIHIRMCKHIRIQGYILFQGRA